MKDERRRMRDPLGGLPVKWKLTAMFAGVGLLAFGVGGTLAWQTAEGALERAMVERLELRARAWGRTLDGHLTTLVRRAEDFASDGHIRRLAEELGEDLTAERRTRLTADLDRHLVQNKLPLEAAFADLTLLAPDGTVLHAVHRAPRGRLARQAASGPEPWIGPFVDSGAMGPRLPIATPLRSLEGDRELGRLVAWVRPGTWIVRALAPERRASAGIELRLVDSGGSGLSVPPAWLSADGPPADSEPVQRGVGLKLAEARSPTAGTLLPTQVFPVAGGGLDVALSLDPSEELAAIAGVQSRFLVVGALLALAASLLLYFPLRYLARPLGTLTQAARRLREGDLSVRVEVESEDEIGALGDAFNRMAAAIEERTNHLERTASDLRTQRRAAGEERDRLRAVISSIREGLVVLDADERVVLSNSAAGPLLRMLSDHELGTLDTYHRCEANERGRDCQECLLGLDQEARSCLVENGGCTYEVHATRLGNSPDGRAGRVLLCRDVSDRMVQDERHIHQERLAVLGEVAAVFAHELNNPLAAIRMYDQLLASALPADSELQEHVAVIARNTETCSRTIRELLDYATGATPEVGPVSVTDLLEDVAVFLRPLIDRSGVRLEVVPEAETEELEVTGDEIQLRQVFVNLLMNAVQAQEEGGRVVLRASLADAHLVVDVEDEGPGIPPEAREQVFRPFYTTKHRGEGTGLGLSTARRIAELHGGGLELVESRPGRTCFRVRLRRSVGVPA